MEHLSEEMLVAIAEKMDLLTLDAFRQTDRTCRRIATDVQSRRGSLVERMTGSKNLLKWDGAAWQRRRYRHFSRLEYGSEWVRVVLTLRKGKELSFQFDGSDDSMRLAGQLLSMEGWVRLGKASDHPFTLWERWGPELRALVGAAAGIALIYGVQHLVRRQYRVQLDRHLHDLASVDPAVVTRWEKAHQFETDLNRLKEAFRRANTTQIQQTYWVHGETRTRWISVPCHRYSHAEYWSRFGSRIEQVAEGAGYTMQEAYLHFVGITPRAGTHPIAPAPSRLGFAFIGLLASSPGMGLGGVGLLPLWLEADELKSLRRDTSGHGSS